MPGIRKVIAIGASTGGVSALSDFLLQFPPSIPPMVVVIHMQVGLSSILAVRLDAKCAFSVREARTGDYLRNGQVLIAPAGKHIKLVGDSQNPTVECFVGEKVNSVMPSADILFESAAGILRQNAIGVIMTGIGADGARGLLKMRECGAVTIGQDKATSFVYGMPKVAMEMGAVTHQLPLGQMAGMVKSLI